MYFRLRKRNRKKNLYILLFFLAEEGRNTSTEACRISYGGGWVLSFLASLKTRKSGVLPARHLVALSVRCNVDIVALPNNKTAVANA